MGNIDMKACCREISYKDVKVGVHGYGYGPVTESVDRNMNEVPLRQKMFFEKLDKYHQFKDRLYPVI
jgi:hypothetical protein